MSETTTTPRRRRLRACVEAWPECQAGDYNPKCCRFPKSCSADIYNEQYVTEADLEEAVAEPTVTAATDDAQWVLAMRLAHAMAALHKIAATDYRGPRPTGVVDAENALREIKGCACHAG